jgi:hypothetical protein
MVTMIGNVLWGSVQLAVAWVGLQRSALRDNQPWGLLSPLEVKSPPLDFAVLPLEGVWHGMPLGEFIFCFFAPLPLLLLLLLMLSA